MMNIMKSKKSAMLMSNIAGMISGILLVMAGAYILKRRHANNNSLRSKAKRAFKTIEDTIAM
ncbi:MAG: hypothetical protein CVU97_05050 [Firmicutes bacterium HGW-Firmicutes-21]|nr:MAG: hypothetical protein CVU97_05050 [Firmicutes bacterium HGW-Firmicutes-21]